MISYLLACFGIAVLMIVFYRIVLCAIEIHKYRCQQPRIPTCPECGWQPSANTHYFVGNCDDCGSSMRKERK